MLREFIDFVEGVLPSVSPDLRDGAKNAILQFKQEEKDIQYISNELLEEVSQGDILSKVPFSYYDENGLQSSFSADAMILSTSCNIDQKPKIVMAPVFPMDAFNGNVGELKKNTIFDYMYIDDIKLRNHFVDFSTLNTFNKKLISDGLKTGKIIRKVSLNQLGYYFLVIKLTIYFMRKEDPDTLGNRLENMNV
ncbi:MAG: hypothetical protein RSE41_10265 [Clostridia bacterium]